MNLPHSVEAEQAVIGGAMFRSDCLGMIDLSPEDFLDPRCRIVFQAMHSLYVKGVAIDPVTVHTELGDRCEPIGGFETLSNFLSATPTADNIEHYAAIVKSKATQRAVIITASQIRTRGETDPGEDFVDWASEAMAAVAINGSSGPGMRPILEVGKEAWKGLAAAVDKKDIGGVKTGLDDVDSMLCGGLQPTDLILLAARPSVGKTSLAINIGVNAAYNGFPVAIFSLEMSSPQLYIKAIGSEAQVNMASARQGNITTAEMSTVIGAVERINKLPIEIDETPSLGVNEVRARARKWALKNKSKTGLIIIDYLQLMSARQNKNGTREQEISIISKGVKGLAKELNIPILALSQLNRRIEQRDDKRPMLSDLRDGGSLEQDADVVMFLHRDFNSKNPAKGDADLIIAKHRNGPTGDVRLVFDERYTKFTNKRASYDF